MSTGRKITAKDKEFGTSAVKFRRLDSASEINDISSEEHSHGFYGDTRKSNIETTQIKDYAFQNKESITFDKNDVLIYEERSYEVAPKHICSFLLSKEALKTRLRIPSVRLTSADYEPR